MNVMQHKATQYLLPLLKTAVVIACGVVLYHQLQKPSFLNAWSQLDVYRFLPYFCLMVLASLAAWCVESVKWSYLVRGLCLLRFRESLILNLIAQVTSFITPLRAGEFITKATYFPKKRRKKISLLVAIGNGAQLLVTIALGLLASVFFISWHWWTITLIALLILGCFALRPLILKMLQQRGYHLYSLRKWLTVIGLSILRYSIFSSSWFIAWWFMGLLWRPLDLALSIAVFYLYVSVVPIIQYFDIVLRWTAGLFLFTQLLPMTESQVVLLITLVWLSNTVAPTIMGALLLPFFKYKKA